MNDWGWGVFGALVTLLRVCWRFRTRIFSVFWKTWGTGRAIVTWKRTAIILAVVLAGYVSYPHVRFFLDEWREAKELEREQRAMYLDTLKTKPVCHSDDCRNFRWTIEKCYRESSNIGITSMSRAGVILRFNHGRASRYFRGCLLEAGFEWERCMSDEDVCILVESP